MFTVRKDGPHLDFAVVKDELEQLLESTANLLEREWPACYANVDSGKVIFYTRMRIVINTYASIMWLCAEVPEDPRRKMLVLSTPPLVRTLFEELMSLIFFFQDLPAVMVSYALTNYTEQFFELKHAKKHHGGKPEWDAYISKLETGLTKMANSLALAPDQIANPSKNIGRWPTPGRMITIVRKRWPKSSDIEFMEFVQSWLYRTLSGDTHLNFHGAIRRGSFYAGKEIRTLLGEEEAKAKGRETFEAFKMEMIWTMLSLLLSIISEIEGHFQFGLSTRAKYLWTIFEQNSDLAREFYKARYESMLS